MGINRENINAKINKRMVKRLSILFFCISIPVGVVLAVYYSLHGNDRTKDYKIAEDTYERMFVKREHVDSSLFVGDAVQEAKDIYDAYNGASSSDLPVYHSNPPIRFITHKTQSVFQMDDNDFVAGKNAFATWGSKIIFIFNSDHHIKEIQYKNATH